jgi:hypothetical protein
MVTLIMSLVTMEMLEHCQYSFLIVQPSISWSFRIKPTSIMDVYCQHKHLARSILTLLYRISHYAKL